MGVEEGVFMKIKQIVSRMTLAAIMLGLLTGCSADNTLGSIPDRTPENPMAATLLSAEEDARLKEDLQKDIDAILNTETEIIHSDTYIPGETYTGNAYYVSADGDDNNDGLTPETAWQSVAKVGQESMAGGILQFGDAVFFRRGDLFRSFDYDPGTNPFTCRIDGITYSAYGEGAKPIITSSPENGAGAEKWQLVYEGENGTRIWQFYHDLTDIASIVFDDDSVAERVYEWCASESVGEGSEYVSCTLNGWWMHEDVGAEVMDELLPLEETLVEDMTFVSRPARWPANEFMNSSATGPLYLRCDRGNPGELYDSVEFSGFEIRGLISVEASDIVFDNLSLRYTGTSFIKNDPSWKANKNTVIQNCEFAYGGGSVSFYRITDSGAKIVEVQGDGIYCVVRNATIRNNYMHDNLCSSVCFEDAVPSYPNPTDDYGYCHILDNVFVDTLGMNLDCSERESSDALKHLDSLIVRGNQAWRTGSTSDDQFIYSCGALILYSNFFDECIIEDNVFYGMENGYPGQNVILSFDTYTDGDVGYTKPQIQDNIYAQYSGGKFASFLYHGWETWYINDEDVVQKTADLLGDTSSKFYVIPTE
ncbi:MAG: hypothetical protein E7445_08775 [Ruminococcaceae bacterium]|nr:hypothetical protein [Oscillospiraceae bacterium]